MEYKSLVAENLKIHIDLEEDIIQNSIKIPPQSKMGDLTFPCFELSKLLGKSPSVIAAELCPKLNTEGFEKIEAIGPYINFFVDKVALCQNIIKKVLLEGDSYGTSNVGEGRVITIEYSSPNISKPFQVEDLASTVIGNSLYKTYKSQGYTSIAINHLGDWGAEFGKLLSGFKRWGDEEALSTEPIKEMLRIYLKFYDETEKKPILEYEAIEYFKNLQEGREEEVRLWNEFKHCGLTYFHKIYDILGVKFDSYAWESFYNEKRAVVIEEIHKKALLVTSNDAEVVSLQEYNMPPFILKKADAVSIHATGDLAAAKYRKENYNFVKSLYVAGRDQSLHFKQVFTTLKLMGNLWADNCVHVPFGAVKFADQKLSSKRGHVVFLEDFFNEAVSKTLDIINEKNPTLENKETAGKTIGIGAIVFSYLKNHRQGDVVFDFGEMLSFEGDTASYVQYTYARGRSILRSYEIIEEDMDFAKLNFKEEFQLIKLLSNFNATALLTLDKYEPSMLAKYVLDVAKAFNKVYNNQSILSTGDILFKNPRLKIIEATCQVIKNALYLLGIDVVEKI
ncbi:MAG: arginine--tRNA ligase [Clostridium sp.]